MADTDGHGKPKIGEGTIRHYWMTAGAAVVLAALITGATGAAVAIYTRSGSSVDIGGITIRRQQASPAPTATTMPAQTPSAAPSAAAQSQSYEADWSGGLSGWTGGAEWKAVAGMLVSDGTGNGDDTVLAPYQPHGPDYAIEAQIHLLRKPVSLATCYFGIVGRGSGSGGGYYVGPHNNGGSYALVVARMSGGYPQVASQNDDPGVDFHLYRVEFKGNQITVKIDGNPVLQAPDNQYLDPGKIGLFSYGCPIEIRTFRAESLPG